MEICNPTTQPTAWPNSICWERSCDKVISSRTATQWTLWWHCLSQEQHRISLWYSKYPEKWSGVFFRRGLKLWLPREILLWACSHQLDSMWSPSPRPLSDVPLPAFLEQDRKWNVERRAWLCSSSTRLQRRSPCGVLKIQTIVVTHAWGPGSSMMWVCLLRAQWKSLFHS